MKKFLSLVLALVMTMSLVTIGAGATFTDDDKIAYTEAVEVMKAVKVVDGYADGAFKPTNTLTRGAAAKMICNLLLGPTTAENLVATVAPYSDVAADSTFAGYIAYCKNAGIISGYADGTFKPANPLTGLAFLKMLLCALGFDQNIEGYVGENWGIAVAKQALAFDLTDGNKNFVGSKAVTREEACLYALNTLQARPVKYTNKGTTVTINGAEIVTGASSWSYKYTELGPIYTLYMDDLFNGDLVKTPTSDVFYRGASNWTYDGKDVGTYANAAKFVFTTEQSKEEIASAMKGYTMDGYKINLDTKPTNNAASDADSALTWDNTKSVAENIAGLTANGKLVEFYTTKTAITDIVIVNYTVAEVTGVSTNKTGDVSYILKTAGGTESGKDYADEDKTDSIITEEKLAKKDIVTYAVDKDSNIHVYPTTKVTGVVTQAKNAKYVMVDGEKYLQSGTVAANKDAQDLYIDQYGVVVKSDFVDKQSDVVYVVSKWNQTGDYGAVTAKAQIVDVEGNVSVITLNSETAASVYAGGLFTYYTNSKDTAVTTEVTSTADAYKVATGTQIKTTTAKLTSAVDGQYYYFANDVAFINMNNTGADLKVTVNKGVQAVASTAANTYMVMDDGEIVAMFIPNVADDVVDKDDVLFVAKTTLVGTALDKKGDSVNLYTAYRAGEKMTIPATSASQGTFYTYSVKEDTGRYALTPVVAGAYKMDIDTRAGKVYNIAQDTYINLGDGLTDAVLAKDCDVYDLTENGIVDLASLVAYVESNAGDPGFFGVTVHALYDAKESEVTCIYVTEYQV